MFKNVCWAQRLFFLMVAGLFILSVSSMLSGCGNKGPLYLPDARSKNDSKKSTQNLEQDLEQAPEKKPNTNPIKKKS